MQLFAPFTLDINKEKINISENKAIAASVYLNDKEVNWEIIKTETSIKLIIKIDAEKTSSFGIVSQGAMLYTHLTNQKTNKEEHASSGFKEYGDGSRAEILYDGLDSPNTYLLRFKISKQTLGGDIMTKGTLIENIYPGLSSDGSDQFITKTVELTASGTTEQTVAKGSGLTNDIDAEKIKSQSTNSLPACGIIGEGTIMGCVAQGVYYLLFKPTSYIFAISGKALDFALMYSISDTSYRSSFVTEGWGIVRDFCNMFFIFVLLYVAFSTILDLNGAKTKEMIVNVVIIGILINFSLFATKIIIDTSNILARVFYNQNTISISSNGENSELGEFNEIKLSEALISRVNPQALITRGEDITKIQLPGTSSVDESGKSVTEGDKSLSEKEVKYTDGNIDAGNFIIITLLTVIVNIVGIWVFLSCTVLFVIRVVGLWVAMIVVPFAFFSYTVPQLQSIDMVGWKKWWPETLSLAFMAPIFAFFMYIIVGFADKGLGVVDAALTGERFGVGLFISVTLPFVFLMILLLKAKDITKKLSGDIGKTAMDYASKIGKTAMSAGGLVAGGAMGLSAGILRNTVGRAGSAIANSQKVNDKASEGSLRYKLLKNIGNVASKGSMDVRGIKIGGKQLSQVSIGGKSMESFGFKPGKAKDTNFEKIKAEKIKKKQKRAEEFEVSQYEPLKQNLNKTETDLQKLLIDNAKEIDTVDKLIERRRQEAIDAERVLKAASNTTERADARIKLAQANNRLKESQDRKKALREGKDFQYIDDSNVLKTLEYSKTATHNGRGINRLEELKKYLDQKIKVKNAERGRNYAQSAIWFGMDNTTRQEIEHKIIMQEKFDSGKK